MERTSQWVSWFALIQIFLNLINAMPNGRKLTTSSNDHSDFISIDCGASNGYTDPQTGISYQTDAGFVDTGNNFLVAPDYRYIVDYLYFGRQLQTVRSFPEGRRNCYTLKPKQGKNQNYLIRAFFAYGNQDGKNQPPSFDLYIGTSPWTDVNPTDGYYDIEEIIHTPAADTIHVCLVKSGEGTPFISTLELRPLTNSIYTTPSSSQSLLSLDLRLDVGFINTDWVNDSRYTDDIYDRMWRTDNYGFKLQNWNAFKKSVGFNPQSTNGSYRLPERVLQSAAKSSNRSSALNVDCEVLGGPYDQSFNYYVYFHFAEIEKLPLGQKRVIDITVNGENFLSNITLEYLKPLTVFTVTNQSCIPFSISATSESAAPPILNALEVYKLIAPVNLPTDPRDVDAILNIKITYKISKLDWQGDPCFPNYAWEGLTCSSGTVLSHARITSLNLSLSKLTGHIASSFSQLTELESLDLSDNNLSGTLPEFIAELPKLKVLDLRGNKLTGPIPNIFKEKSDLEMSLDGNRDLCWTDPCKKHKFVFPLIASVSALIVVILVSLGIWIIIIKRRKGDFTRHELSKLRNRTFSYSNIHEITNNFQSLIGEGGFGKVYLGILKNDTQVAVKLLSQSSVQGHREFRSEVELLMVVHHRHVVSLIGYCEETGARALIYEYMANGDLRQHLSGNNWYALKWTNMLRIALDASCGL